eukprot:CAMPEP_0176343612 /NCGR_PEP_ID=MMETSP0126-20121128/4078_1 /TAXON_ID=141414 ORGANISM="Strombidinopsis acuminatum, Strain SPMC142" /NCGR_SAMPLE_ID=MMETSP0126 /ASSEMBLY_ACC=CAM_ASM_000229 /LENGTH=149 /DNA_ID=CAMNT_0017689655 /DNA_START=1013 /DNA_END=1462 /DNA_ORIENTATION=+
MEKNNYNFYVRPTIGYSLSCEAQGKTREQAYTSFSSRINYPVEGQALMAFRLGISLLVIGIVMIWATIFAIDETDKGYGGAALCWMTLMFGMYLPLLLAYQKDMNIINGDLDALEAATWTMQCVDPHSFIGSVDFIEGGYDGVSTKFRA